MVVTIFSIVAVLFTIEIRLLTHEIKLYRQIKKAMEKREKERQEALKFIENFSKYPLTNP